VAERTGGRSLETNVALLRNNARVAAQVASALSSARWDR
jgi:pseudouridine-5'-phosphate glycosidase